MTLCLYRYRDGYVSGEEFRSVLHWYGFSDREIVSLNRVVEECKDLPSPEEFVRRLRDEVGVSALRERSINVAAEQPSPAGEDDGSEL
jgi:hypothetical protein